MRREASRADPSSAAAFSALHAQIQFPSSCSWQAATKKPQPSPPQSHSPESLGASQLISSSWFEFWGSDQLAQVPHGFCQRTAWHKCRQRGPDVLRATPRASQTTQDKGGGAMCPHDEISQEILPSQRRFLRRFGQKGTCDRADLHSVILRAAQNPSLGLPFLLCLQRKAQGLAQALPGQYHHGIYW